MSKDYYLYNKTKKLRVDFTKRKYLDNTCIVDIISFIQEVDDFEDIGVCSEEECEEDIFNFREYSYKDSFYKDFELDEVESNEDKVVIRRINHKSEAQG